MCDSPDQAAHYHIPDVYVRDFISEPAFGWSQRKETKLLNQFQQYLLFSSHFLTKIQTGNSLLQPHFTSRLGRQTAQTNQQSFSESAETIIALI